MTDYGLLATGPRRKTLDEICTDIEAWQRSRISTKLDLSERTVLGNCNAIFADQLAQAWEAWEAAAGALDPDNAIEFLQVALAKLTGVVRRGATKGRVTATITFSKATSVPLGALTLAVSGEESNLWTNVAGITATVAGDVDAVFESTVAASTATAASGTLTTIVTPIDGVTAATNALDAEPGTDIETIDALRIRREASLAATGKATVPAIEAALAQVEGVFAVRVFENTSDETDGDGIPAHSVRAVVWDGDPAGADDDEIAAALYAARGAGRPAWGSESGTLVDAWGETKTEYFDRAVQVPLTIAITVAGDTTEAAVKAALVAAADYTIDEDVIRQALISAVMALSGVTDVSACTINGGTTNVIIAADEVATLDSSDITVTL
jgi:uncharacterized phage protein gp47/JayE